MLTLVAPRCAVNWGGQHYAKVSTKLICGNHFVALILGAWLRHFVALEQGPATGKPARRNGARQLTTLRGCVYRKLYPF